MGKGKEQYRRENWKGGKGSVLEDGYWKGLVYRVLVSLRVKMKGRVQKGELQGRERDCFKGWVLEGTCVLGVGGNLGVEVGLRKWERRRETRGV